MVRIDLYGLVKRSYVLFLLYIFYICNNLITDLLEIILKWSELWTKNDLRCTQYTRFIPYIIFLWDLETYFFPRQPIRVIKWHILGTLTLYTYTEKRMHMIAYIQKVSQKELFGNEHIRVREDPLFLKRQFRHWIQQKNIWK